MTDWRIHRRETCCSQCGRGFDEGETFFSRLHLEADPLRREDLCPGCFRDPGEASADVLFWRTHHVVDRRARFAVDFEAIEELFLALEGRKDGRRSELRYLLALLLLRKKRLKLVGVRRHADGEVLCVRRPRRQEEFEVQVHELDSERTQALRAELARVFDGSGLESIGAPEPAPLGGTQVGEAGSGDPRP